MSARIMYDFRSVHLGIKNARQRGDQKTVDRLLATKARWVKLKRAADYARKRRRLIKKGEVYVPQERVPVVTATKYGEMRIVWFNECRCHPGRVTVKDAENHGGYSVEFKSRRQALRHYRKVGWTFLGEL